MIACVKRFGRDRHNWHHCHLLASPPCSSHRPSPLLLQKVSLLAFKPKDVMEEFEIKKSVLTRDMPAKQNVQFLTVTTCIVQRWILSITFKRDVNNDYGIYPESGDVVMEVVDQNAEYEYNKLG